MTDNGPAYRSYAWRARCATLGLRHLRTPPYTPRTNGKAERFIQILLDAARAYCTLGEITRTMRRVFGVYEQPTFV